MKTVNLILLFLLCLLQYRLWFGDGNIPEVRRLQLRYNELSAESTKLHERNKELEADVVDLKEGLDAVEERARQDLGMVKADEVFIQVIEAGAKRRPPPPPMREDDAAKSSPPPMDKSELPSED